MSKPTQDEIERELQQFSGSETMYQHGLVRSIVFTEGVKYLADAAGAYWLLDAIVSHQMNPRVAREEFQVWKLRRVLDVPLPAGEAGWALTCEDGNENVVVEQRFSWSDFPLERIDVWFTNSTLLLPSEY